jgi:hypothetical protein
VQSPIDPKTPAPDVRADPLDATQRWLEAAVIGLNLCPFAKAVQAKGQIRWVLAEAAGAEPLLEGLAEEALRLARSEPEAIDTTLIVARNAPAAFGGAHGFLRIVEAGEGLLEALGLSGVLQLAAFHPRWRFAGVRADDIANASNRAPYPTLHLLREASVARAAAAVPDAEAIWGRNVQTLRALGPAGWQALAAGWTGADRLTPGRPTTAEPGPPPGPTSSARSGRRGSARPPASPATAPAAGRRSRGR